MASDRDLELLDDYISNRLTGADRAYVEGKLAQDPDYRSEYDIQQQVANGLRKARAAQIKQMLNNVEIPPATFDGIRYARIAVAAIVTALVLSLTYHYWPSQENEAVPGPISSGSEVSPQVSESADKADVSQQASEEPASIDENTPLREPAIKRPAKTSTPKPATIDVFDPSEEAGSSHAPEAPGIADGTKSSMRASEMVVETDNSSRKYSFHYQVKAGRLILYGSFEKNVYEILEFFSDEKRTVFLFYRSNYYLLDTSSESIKPLAPVTDQNLIKKLQQYRSGR